MSAVISAKKDPSPILVKEKGLPTGMGARLWTMFWFTLALGFTGFGNLTEFAYMPFFGWIGIGIAMLMFLLWRDRTLPRANGFWILLGILWFALVFMPIRPYLGLVATLPVALLWLHDSPATPSAMLAWGMLATIRQDPQVWSAADSDTAFFVVLAMLFVIGAAQAERERLARSNYAATGRLWMTSRLGALMLWSLALLGARESLQAVSIFTYLGFDLANTSGKVTMIAVMLLCLAIAAVLFRVRPYKYADPYAQPTDKQGRRIARQSVVQQSQFDEAPLRAKATKVAKAITQPSKPSVKVTRAKPAVNARPSPETPKAPKPDKPKNQGAVRPGEIDFD